MEFLSKLLNPFGKNNEEREYKDLSKESKKVVPRPASELLLYARDIAGLQIQERMLMLNNCRWIRAEHTYPAFDNMNFIHKNKIFSVIIDIQDFDGESYLPEGYINRQLSACRKHNLIPCKFPVVVDNPHNPNIKSARALKAGWNLYNTETNELVIPEHIATTEMTPMSEWELRNFSIMFMRKYLQSQGMNVLSFQDTMEVDPQLWFLDKSGRKCWLVARCEKAPKKKIDKPEKMNEIIRRCFTYDGYFGGIILTPINDDKSDTTIYRNGNVTIDFQGVEKVHTTM
jgi:hypothetical protein